MKFVILAVLSAVVGLLSFQNCNKKAISNSEIANQSPQIQKISFTEGDLQKISFFIDDKQNVTNGNHSYTLKFQKTLAIDLKTGQLVESSDVAESMSKTYCLTDEIKTELLSFLIGVEVCKVQPNLAPDVLCAQAMRPAYSELTSAGGQFLLGSASDSCGHNAVDLCEGAREQLQKIITKINAIYSTMKCAEPN